MVQRVVVHMMRHEKTAGNMARQYVGSTDEPIVAIERQPLTTRPLVVHGSTLQRCRQTAALYFPNATYEAHEGLCELHFGQFEMKTYDELQHRADYRAWIDNPLAVTPTDGEPFTQFVERVEAALAHIVNEAGSYVFVVHGGVIRYMQQRAHVASFQQATATHGTIYTFTWDSLAQLKEGHACTSYSAAPITAKLPMQSS